ncbi:DnaJ-class molecular chaperone [Parabacteroides sp. PF5-5]|uniref:hypothetical protein n=1 Tax=unclassified Parabacteroides TaxID=2649774 RepID=UPI0024748695|nr:MULTISPECIES: hypothetical protein [unclassified Parabacteroides]MDH6303665.1 DnaJ-class molecular chaperone [Parabacteroides sp. PH5-39]MDH6314987.1 DnaJ-class molecular chaperone [Parabacteroides sp. PF5-13]MDH6318324.1 DnaJ-class molecular chaperone [Parabacteroides sp. PH5-13]MDH6321744.1 DnaJ-class molecular chaperone [Parabacteroides sp. PH5-8]MDH6325867.1 DnaJ-class molecular chaperone [Parabacteroides sp. PH5-41]
MKRILAISVILISIATMVYAYQVTCGRCNGSGTDPLTYPCSYCNHGKVEKVESVNCSLCSGKGEVQNSNGNYQRCPSCLGAGSKNITVQVNCSTCNGSDSERRQCRSCNGVGKVDDGK